jgi:hypothetical protein
MTTLLDSLLLLHVGSTWYMVGVIWFVQRVHYPLMARVAPDRFSDFERDHQRRTTPVVMPAMVVEMATAVLLAMVPVSGINRIWTTSALALLVLVWGSTFLLQVPDHTRLTRGWDATTHQRLVRLNWIRTVLWTLRGLFVLFFLFLFVHGSG